MNIQMDYTGEEVEITRDDDDNVTLSAFEYELDMNKEDLDTLIKALVYFRDEHDKTALDTGLKIPADKHVAFP